MNAKAYILICSIAILISFFLPIFEWHSFEMSGLNYILSSHIPVYKYLMLLIPVSCFILLWESLHEGMPVINPRKLSWIPLVVLIVVMAMRYFKGTEPTFFSDIDFGFWLILGFSVAMLLVKGSRPRKSAI